MSAPTQATRKATYARDAYRCVLCYTSENPTYQHRRATGMGGSKVQPSPVDGCVLCLSCNTLIEQDARWQTIALARGVKVRRWADPGLVPIYVYPELQWYRLEGVKRVPITAVVAHEAMHAVYGNEWLQWWAEANR